MENNRKFRSIIGTILDIPEDQVTGELSAETVDTWDSLNHINLLSALEQEFGLTLATDSLAEAHSVPKLKALLAEHGVEV